MLPESAKTPRPVRFDPEHHQRQLMALLNDYATWMQTERVRQVVGHEMLMHLRQQDLQIEARLQHDFLLVVMGDFKRGKSTLINALLCTPIATTNVAPETVTINEIRYGAMPRAGAHIRGGGYLEIAPDELEAERLVPLLADAVRNQRPPLENSTTALDIGLLIRELSGWLVDDFSPNEFDTLMSDLGVRPSEIDGETVLDKARNLIEHQLHRGNLRKLMELLDRPGKLSKEVMASVSRLISPTPDPTPAPTSRRLPGLERIQQRVDKLVIEAPINWLRGIALVDTPGTGDLLMRFDDQVRSYVQKADALIYVTSALSPLSESEQAFLHTAIPTRDFPKILFVVNRLDAMRDERSARRLVEAARTRIRQIFPDAPVFGVSALQEFRRVQGEEPPQPTLAGILDDAFDRFRASLQESILLNRDLIHLDRSVCAAEQMVAEFEVSVLKLWKALDSSQPQHAPNQNEWGHSHAQESQPPAVISSMRVQIEALADVASAWMSEFLDRIGLETSATLARARAADIQRYFIFFFVETLHTALNRCLDAQRPLVLELFNQAKIEIHLGAPPATDAAAQAPIANPTVGTTVPPGDTWATIDTFDALVDLSLGSVFNTSNELLAPVADLFAQSQAPITQEHLAHIQERLRVILPDLKQAVDTELHSLYEAIARSLEQQIEVLFQQNILATQTAMRQAHVLHSEGGSLTAVETTLEMIVATCARSRGLLQALRNQLWQSEVEDAFESSAESFSLVRGTANVAS